MLATSIAVAGNDFDPDRWEFAGSVYLWGASISGTSAEGDDNDTFDDVNISGPYAGVKFWF